MAVRLQIRNDTASNWQQHNPILATGELAIENDTRRFKIGNGNQAWNNLLYATQGETGSVGPIGKSIQFIWNGSELGIRVEGQSNYQYVDLTGPQGPQGKTGNISNLEAFHIEDALGYNPISPTQLNDKVKTDVPLNAKFTDTNTTYTEITTAEIDAGASTTLRTITGRRVKYILDKVQGWISGLTKSDVGLGNVDNVKQASKVEHDQLTTDFSTHQADDANPHSTNKTHIGLQNVDNVKQMPISNGVLENYREKLVTVTASDGSINISLGNVFQHTPSGNRTYSITNAVNGQAHSFTLIINMGATVRTLTFPEGIKWQGGEIPDMSTANKTYVLTFMSVNGGTNWLGMFGGEF